MVEFAFAGAFAGAFTGAFAGGFAGAGRGRGLGGGDGLGGGPLRLPEAKSARACNGFKSGLLVRLRIRKGDHALPNTASGSVRPLGPLSSGLLGAAMGFGDGPVRAVPSLGGAGSGLPLLLLLLPVSALGPLSSGLLGAVFGGPALTQSLGFGDGPVRAMSSSGDAGSGLPLLLLLLPVPALGRPWPEARAAARLSGL